MGRLLLEASQSDAPALCSNAILALSCMPLCGVYATVPGDVVFAALLQAIAAERPLHAAAAASGLAICLTGSDEFSEDALQTGADALFALVARGAGGAGDQQAAAAALVSLACIASTAATPSDSGAPHELLQQVFSLAVLLLQQLEPQCAGVLTQITAGLQSGPAGFTLKRTPPANAALTALEALDALDAAPLAYAAVRAVAMAAAALPAPQAEVASPLLPALLKVTMEAQDADSAAYGMMIGAVTALPRVVAALHTAGLVNNAAKILKLRLPERVAGSAADACVLRAALAAQAQVAALHFAADAELQSHEVAASAFLRELPEHLQRAYALPRARYAASAPALAAASLLGVLPTSFPPAQRLGAGLLHDTSAESVAASKQAVQLLERHTVAGSAKVDPLSAWLCTLACRVRAHGGFFCLPDCGVCFHSHAYVHTGAMCIW